MTCLPDTVRPSLVQWLMSLLLAVNLPETCIGPPAYSAPVLPVKFR